MSSEYTMAKGRQRRQSTHVCLTVSDLRVRLLVTVPSGGVLVRSNVFTGARGNEALFVLNKKSYLTKI